MQLSFIPVAKPTPHSWGLLGLKIGGQFRCSALQTILMQAVQLISWTFADPIDRFIALQLI